MRSSCCDKCYCHQSCSDKDSLPLALWNASDLGFGIGSKVVKLTALYTRHHDSFQKTSHCASELSKST